jgi:drug/metabolite transporter (DMT)-like permease
VNENVRGILAILTAATGFALNDALVKLVTEELPSGEIISIRGGIATAMLCVGVLVIGARRPLGLLIVPMMLLRLGSSAAATVCIVISLRHLPTGDCQHRSAGDAANGYRGHRADLSRTRLAATLGRGADRISALL